LLYLSPANGNSLYYISEAAAGTAMLRSINDADPQDAMNQVIGDSLKVSALFLEFSSGCMLVCLKRWFTDEIKELETIELSDAQPLEEITIPFFAELPKEEKLNR
jgi:hypothetical protein